MNINQLFQLNITVFDMVHGSYDTEIVDIYAESIEKALAKYKTTLPSYAVITGHTLRF